MARPGFNFAQLLAPFAVIVFSLVIILTTQEFVARISPLLLFGLGMGVIVAVFLALKPLVLFWFTTVMALFAVGLLKYFVPGSGAIWWLVYGSSALMYIVAAIQVARGCTVDISVRSVMLPPVMILCFLLLLISAGLNSVSIGQWMVSIKSIFMMGGVWALLSTVHFKEMEINKWTKGILWIALIQWIPVVYQYAFVRSYRIETGRGTIEASDSVVGTFGGTMTSGGLTAVLAFFLVSILLLLLAYRREKLISKRALLLMLMVVFFPLLLMEVKIVFFYLPVGLIVLYRNELLSRPMFAIGALSSGAVLLLGLLFAYQTLHWSAKSEDIQSNIERAFSYSFESRTGGASEPGVLTRRGAIEFWWNEHADKNYTQLFLGHGLGSARTQGQVIGAMAIKNYPRIIDRTGLSMMLWEVGMIGVILLLWMWFLMWRLVARISRQKLLDVHHLAMAKGLHAIMPLFVMSLLYRNDIPYAAPMMFLLMASFGLISWLSRRSVSEATV